MLTHDAFAEKTCLILNYHVEEVLATTPNNLTPEQVDWFTTHVSARVRYLHAHNLQWQKWLENRNKRIDPRDQIKVWIRHWLTAYLMDNERYRRNAESAT